MGENTYIRIADCRSDHPLQAPGKSLGRSADSEGKRLTFKCHFAAHFLKVIFAAPYHNGIKKRKINTTYE